MHQAVEFLRQRVDGGAVVPRGMVVPSHVLRVHDGKDGPSAAVGDDRDGGSHCHDQIGCRPKGESRVRPLLGEQPKSALTQHRRKPGHCRVCEEAERTMERGERLRWREHQDEEERCSLHLVRAEECRIAQRAPRPRPRAEEAGEVTRKRRTYGEPKAQCAHCSAQHRHEEDQEGGEHEQRQCSGALRSWHNGHARRRHAGGMGGRGGCGGVCPVELVAYLRERLLHQRIFRLNLEPLLIGKDRQPPITKPRVRGPLARVSLHPVWSKLNAFVRIEQRSGVHLLLCVGRRTVRVVEVVLWVEVYGGGIVVDRVGIAALL
eukprot:scaffold241953_cov31-Tisochrysis_lutea.AAC.2